jgi:diaminopimelate decarboxylase
MSFNGSIRYIDNRLFIDQVPLLNITHEVDTPLYVYSLRRALGNYQRLQEAFAPIGAHIHFSAKANGTMAVLKALIQAGAGIDAVSGGEVYKAVTAGCEPASIVFAGAGKTTSDIRYALTVGVGWFNIENVDEARIINEQAKAVGRSDVRVAVRLNPDVTASTHPNIATGHGSAKFGLTAEAIRDLLARQGDYPHLRFEGVHVHIGSNLQTTQPTREAVERALELIAPYAHMRTVNIGGGFPAQYHPDEDIPTPEDFARALQPLLAGYNVLLEPGRAIIADAGILVTKVLYTKFQGGQHLAIVDASMTELIRPMLYNAKHEIVPAHHNEEAELLPTQVHGPVCETTDVLGRDVLLPELETGDLLAILTTGAYGSVMSSSYNARPHPAEIIVREDGETWFVARKRDTWSDLVRAEIY